MNHSLRSISVVAAVVASCWVLGWGNPTSAQQDSSVLIEQPAGQPELVPAVPTSPEPIYVAPAQAAPLLEELSPPQGAVTVHPVARIDYDVTHRARRLFGGSAFVELTMVTQNPADGCFYEIPLCLPACCTGEPTMTSYCGLLGRCVVVYCYECGLEIEVKFRLRGDVEVEYGT